MKKLLAVAMLLFVGTISANAAQTIGYIYQNGTTPGGGYTVSPLNKVGTATCKSYFYLVGLGDCSVEAAMKNGKIKSLGGYDVYKKNILGFQKITTRAWGN